MMFGGKRSEFAAFGNVRSAARMCDVVAANVRGNAQPHTFMTKQPDSVATLAALEVIKTFVRYRTALLQ